MDLEQRDYGLADVELRSPGETGGDWHTFTGHAAVFNELSRPLYHPRLGEFREQIMPGAFRDILAAKPDIHFCYDHDMGSAMASTRAGNLDLTETRHGLRVWAQLNPEDRDVQRLIPKVKTRVAGQMSFKFVVGDDQLEERGSELHRTINSFKLIPEVSVLPQGAYSGTDASIRSFIDQAVDLGRIDEPLAEYRRKFTQSERDALAKKGWALPDGSYPIETQADVGPAITLAQSGHGDAAAARALIIKRCKALGCTDMLPKEWRSLDGNVEGHETRSQTPSGDGLGGHDTVSDEARRQAIARIRARVANTHTT